MNLIPHALAVSIPITTGLPGSSSNGSLQGIVTNFYDFALLIAGILAFGAIVYGGVRYAATAGNPSSQSDAKSWIINALLGLLLLGGAYIVLYTINPQIVSLGIPGLPGISVPTSTPPGPPGPPPGPGSGGPTSTTGGSGNTNWGCLEAGTSILICSPGNSQSACQSLVQINQCTGSCAQYPNSCCGLKKGSGKPGCP